MSYRIQHIWGIGIVSEEFLERPAPALGCCSDDINFLTRNPTTVEFVMMTSGPLY